MEYSGWKEWRPDPRVRYCTMNGGITVSVPSADGGRRSTWAIDLGLELNLTIRAILIDMKWPM